MVRIIKNTAGVAMPIALIVGLAVFVVGFVVNLNFQTGHVQEVSAETATTTVTVLNTPPTWTVSPAENPISASTSPTNVGLVVTIEGTASDANGEDYFMIICDDSATATPIANSPPQCQNGINSQIAISGTTTSGAQATAATTTTAVMPEQNDWWASVCDAIAVNPRCNTVDIRQGNQTDGSGSPFAVNHRPTFTAFSNAGAVDPGATTTWRATTTDPDTYGGQDGRRLFVCRDSDFAGGNCGAGGTWCSSATSTTASTSCQFFHPIPTQDDEVVAYGYVVDEHGFEAVGGQQGNPASTTINNVAPTISSSTILLFDTDRSGDLTLLNESATTSDFLVRATIVDNNSCQNISSGDEITSIDINVYRSGIGVQGCNTQAEHNPNNCYTYTTGDINWNTASSTQIAGSCSGSSDTDAVWETSFELWHVADPTDGTGATETQFFSQNWLASVTATDDDSATTSDLVQSATGIEVVRLLAFDLLFSPTVNFGSLEPGGTTTPLTATTTVSATGNIGIDHTLQGDDMCTTYPTCPGYSTSTIFALEQRFASSSVAYTSVDAFALSSSTATTFDINILKTTSTSTPELGDTYWGIHIPTAVTLAGVYTGQNTIIAIQSDAQQW